MPMYALYTLESYQIWEDPDLIALEATIDDSLGNSKIARQEKRLMSAVQAGDEEAIKKIEAEIRENLEAARKAAKAERNRAIAAKLLKLVGTAATITNMIINFKRRKATKQVLKENAERNGGQLSNDVQELLAAQNLHSGTERGVNIASTTASAIGKLIGFIG